MVGVGVESQCRISQNTWYTVGILILLVVLHTYA